MIQEQSKTFNQEPVNLLTSNWHVPYLHLLAKVPNTIWWVLSFRHNMAGRDWNLSYRPLPPNVRHIVVDHPDAVKMLNLSHIQMVVLHSFSDLELFKDIPVRKVMVFHNSLHTEWRGMPQQEQESRRSQLAQVCKELMIHPVFISPWKAQTWGFPGMVILPGIDTDTDFPGGYSGRTASLLRVCSNFAFRDFMNGKNLSDQIVRGMPSAVLGEGNGEECQNTNMTPDGKSLTQVGITRSMEQMKQAFRDHRTLIATNIPAYEDGWNLSILEAMAQGMPIVSSYHPRSPIVDGHNGFMSDQADHLRGKCMEMLRDRDMCQELGQKARETVQREFPLHKFLSAWSYLIAIATQQPEPAKT